MRIPGVVGVALGEEGGGLCAKVYVQAATPEGSAAASSVPQEIEGLAVVVVAVEELRALRL